MKELKFRVWNPTGGEMLESCPSPSNVFANAAFYPITIPEGQLFEEYGEAVIMQSTGISIDGREIYEGDVLSYNVPGLGSNWCCVVWLDDFACFGRVSLTGKEKFMQPFAELPAPEAHLQKYYTHRGHVFERPEWKEIFESITDKKQQDEQLV